MIAIWTQVSVSIGSASYVSIRGESDQRQRRPTAGGKKRNVPGTGSEGEAKTMSAGSLARRRDGTRREDNGLR